MEHVAIHESYLKENGFTTIDGIYSRQEIEQMTAAIGRGNSAKDTFRKNADLFAIRQVLKEIPELQHLIFNEKLKEIIKEVLGIDFFVVKSIYFDKPETSNWYVAYHQDLTISVAEKLDVEHFGPWTVKQNQFAVQPPVEILEGIFTIRIHLDETDADNGALRVIDKSHSKKIYRPETINYSVEKEIICPVGEGGIMIMKPLLLHSSGRTINGKRRRVIHIELSDQQLPGGLRWAEKLSY